MRQTTVFCDFCRLTKPNMTTIRIDNTHHDICQDCKRDIVAKTKGTGQVDYPVQPYIPYNIPVYPKWPQPRRRRWDDVWCNGPLTWGSNNSMTFTIPTVTISSSQRWC